MAIPFEYSRFIIVAGTDGVGKSSFIGALIPHYIHRRLIISEDDNKDEAEERTNTYLKRHVSFCRELNISKKEDRELIKSVSRYGYTVELNYIALNSADECIERIKKRAEKGGRSVLAPLVKMRHKSCNKDLLKVLPYCTEAYLYDNENGFVQVGEYKYDVLKKLTDKPIEWLDDLYKRYKSRMYVQRVKFKRKFDIIDNLKDSD